jgi:hypothetical protein
MTLDDLVHWARQQGAILHEKVEVYDDEKYGVALRVRPDTLPAKIETGGITQLHDEAFKNSRVVQDTHGRYSRYGLLVQPGEGLPAGSQIVSCPFKLSLSYLNALDTVPALKAHSEPFPVHFLHSTEPHVIGHFFLMQQYLMKDASYWAPYLMSLPQPHEHEKLGTPLYYTDADLLWIKGTNLERAKSQREELWSSEWNVARMILDNDNAFAKWNGLWSWDLYRWAATIFSSRSFISSLIPKEVLEFHQADTDTKSISMDTPSGPFPVLFPLVDLANHSPTAQVTWYSNARDEPKDLSIITDSAILEGSQVFNNYAPKSNTELLLGYGFCLPENDEVSIEFNAHKDDLLALRRQQLLSQGADGTKAEQHIFYVRRLPSRKSTDDGRLPVFSMFEEGFVDTLALFVANQHELAVMKGNPRYSLETTLKDSRIAFSVASVLYQKLCQTLSRILIAGKDLK